MKPMHFRRTVTKLFLAVAVCGVWLAVGGSAQTTEKPIWKPEETVEVEWQGKWFKAEILRADGDSYAVHYVGYDAEYDESVAPSRIRALGISRKNDRSEKSEKPETKQKAVSDLTWKDGKGNIKTDWTWTDGAGNIKTEDDFEQILINHLVWLQSGKKGEGQANLTNAEFKDVNLVPVGLEYLNLDYAEMSGISLNEVNLFASLHHANLSGASLTYTKLFALSENINLNGASFYKAEIAGTLSKADLRKATILDSNFMIAKAQSADKSEFLSASLAFADLSGAVINNSNFPNVLFGGANLTDAKVWGGDWTDALLQLTDVTRLAFEPSKVPDTRSFAGAKNLEFITYSTSPDAVTTLRKNLKDNGFDDAQRKITYAIKHRQNELRREQGAENWYKYAYYYLNLVFFDWTVGYGMRPERALIIIFYLWLVFAVVYALFIHFPGRSGIFLVKNRVWKSVTLTAAMRVRPRRIPPTARGWKYAWLWLKSEWRVSRISLYFSALSALHLGYNDLDLGRWLQMLTKREYELRPKHWSRSLAGLQSLISFYLIVMWALTEFINPFD